METRDLARQSSKLCAESFCEEGVCRNTKITSDKHHPPYMLVMKVNYIVYITLVRAFASS